VQVEAGMRRQQGEAGVPLRLAGAAVAAFQGQLHQSQHGLGFTPGQLLEGATRQEQQLAVAQRSDPRVARLAGQQAGFTHGFTGGDDADHLLPAAGFDAAGAEPAVHQQVHAVGILTLVEQQVAARQGEPFDQVGQRAQGRAAHAGEQRLLGQRGQHTTTDQLGPRGHVAGPPSDAPRMRPWRSVASGARMRAALAFPRRAHTLCG
jgi:hypothetical protein